MSKAYKPQDLSLKNLNWNYFVEYIGGANKAIAKFDEFLFWIM